MRRKEIGKEDGAQCARNCYKVLLPVLLVCLHLLLDLDLYGESTKVPLVDKTGVLCSYEFKIVHMDLELFNTVHMN